jgi:hypothetical protein
MSVRTVSAYRASTALAAFVLLACTRQVPARSGSATTTFKGVEMAECPLALPGASASYDETPDGVAITFRGAAPQLAELRARVQKLASDGEEGLPNACPCSSIMSATGGREARIGPDAHSRAEDTPTGARVLYSARDSGDVVLLRAHMRKYLESLQGSGTCE